MIALLPVATAVASVVRAHERPGPSFWAAAIVGALAALVFAVVQSGGLTGLRSADMLLFGAVVVCSVSYAEGGLLSRELGSWQTISWALVLAAPATGLITGVSVAQSPPRATVPEWCAFLYLSVISMFLGFILWYRGLSIGPMVTVSQVQLAQPVMSIAWAALLLDERIASSTVISGAAVIGCAVLAVRARDDTGTPTT